MPGLTRITSVDEVPENGSFLFTVRESDGREEEVLLVRCAEEDGGVEAWKNFCMHEPDQRLDRGFGAAVREGEMVCPKHGSTFDTCSGHCDNGKAAGTTLVDVAVTVNRGDVFLTDDDLTFQHAGGIDEDDGDDGIPGSSSHLTF